MARFTARPHPAEQEIADRFTASRPVAHTKCSTTSLLWGQPTVDIRRTALYKAVMVFFTARHRQEEDPEWALSSRSPRPVRASPCSTISRPLLGIHPRLFSCTRTAISMV